MVHGMETGRRDMSTTRRMRKRHLRIGNMKGGFDVEIEATIVILNAIYTCFSLFYHCLPCCLSFFYRNGVLLVLCVITPIGSPCTFLRAQSLRGKNLNIVVP